MWSRKSSTFTGKRCSRPHERARRRHRRAAPQALLIEDEELKFGLWTPVPHVIRNEPRMSRALASHESNSDEGADLAFEFAVDVIRRAERFGFHNTLIAQRLLGPDLEAWTLATALAMKTSAIEVMVAVHPGMVTPQVAAKMGAKSRQDQRRAMRHQHRQRALGRGIPAVQQWRLDR